MKKKKSRLKKFLTGLLSVVMILSGVLTAFAGIGTVTDRRQIVLEGGSTTWSFVVKDADGRLDGTCMDPKNQMIPAGGQTADFELLPKASRLAKLAYIGSKEFRTDVQQYAVGRAAAYIAGYIPYNNYNYYTVVNSLIERSKTAVVPDNFEAYIVKPTNGAQKIIAWRNKPEGSIQVKKGISENAHLVNECKGNYSLAGAIYGVYKTNQDAQSNRNRLLTLTTKEDGVTERVSINAGDYFVKEISAPPCFDIDPKIYPVKVPSGNLVVVKSNDAPLFDPLGITIRKKAQEGTDSNLSLEGAEYTVRYYKEFLDGESVKQAKAFRTWIFRTDKNGEIRMWDEWKIGGDELFKEEDGTIAGLFGTYTFEETKAPAGFAKTEGLVSIQQIRPDQVNMNPHKTVLKDVTDIEKPQTVSIILNKVDAETGKNIPQGYGTLKGAKYDLMYSKDGKAEYKKVAVLVTDEKGFAQYSGGKPGYYKLKETQASNGYVVDPKSYEIKAEITEINKPIFTYAVKSKEKPITIKFDKTSIGTDGEKIILPGAELQLLDNKKNVIETFTSSEKPHVVKGLLPGKYFIRETKTPEGFIAPEKDIEFEIKGIEDLQTVEIFNEPIPEIKTFASFKDGCKNSKPGKEALVIDRFEYKSLLAGQKYIVRGCIIDKASGKIAVETEQEFVPKKSNGSINVEFAFDSGKFSAGGDFVVTEKLYIITQGDKRLVAAHEDLNDMGQTICFPSLKTMACDIVDGGKDLNGAKEQTIKDKVMYKNLYPGKSYTVKGTLVKKSTGEALISGGKPVTSEKTFMAEAKEGFVELEFTFDASELKGETIVAFESLYEDEIEVSVHADVEDYDQSVFVPVISTLAYFGNEESKIIEPLESIVISDRVEYKNLIKNQKYILNGVLLDKKSGDVIAESETEFTAENPDGKEVLDFKFDSRKFEGRDIVVFEKLSKVDEDGKVVKVVANHADIDDKNQTLSVKKIPPNVPKTGDSENDGWYLIAAIASLLAIMKLMEIRKKLDD